jgi:hydrogenase nickel incorporation protein HypA/HybF
MGIVDAALEEAQKRQVRVSAVHLRLGALSGVVKDALLFSYEIACQDTPLERSRLIIEDVPVIVFCPQCNAQRTLPSVQMFTCPECGMPTGSIIQGKELEVFALEVEDSPAESSGPTTVKSTPKRYRDERPTSGRSPQKCSETK